MLGEGEGEAATEGEAPGDSVAVCDDVGVREEVAPERVGLPVLLPEDVGVRVGVLEPEGGAPREGEGGGLGEGEAVRKLEHHSATEPALPCAAAAPPGSPMAYTTEATAPEAHEEPPPPGEPT